MLHPHQWTVLPNELLAHMPGLVESHQALPAHVNPRREKLATEAASERTVDPPDVWASRAADLLREVLRTHGGRFDPSYISHRQMGRTAFEDRVYEQLNKLLQTPELKSVVEGHPEFA